MSELKRERIVVIDDNANDAELIRRVIERAGYIAGTAHSGEEGLRLVREIFPDCILVDYRMPGMDGFEVCRHVKADPALQSIPVLLLTGADSASNVIEGLDAGADDFVTKSSDIEILLARVRALLRVKAFQDRIVEQAEQLRGLYDEIKQKSDKIMALNQRLNGDLQIARRVQEALLPRHDFEAHGVRVRSAYIPSETLSGDFYDYFTSGETLYLFIGDVSGHGLAASILVSLLKSFLHSEAVDAQSPAAFMAELNDFLHTASLPAQFATAQLFRFERGAKSMVYSTAAHPPFLMYSPATRRCVAVERPGNLLGAIAGLPFEEDTVAIERGTVLFAYTDGLTDRRNAAGDFYSLDRIAEILEVHGTGEWEALCNVIQSEITAFAPTEEFKDDIAFVMARFED